LTPAQRKTAAWKFETTLVRPEGVGTWTFAPIPIDLVEKTGVSSRLRVRGTIDGVPFIGSLLPAGGGRHFPVVKKEVRDRIGKKAGDRVSLALRPDHSPQVVRLPLDFSTALKADRKALAYFREIAPSHKKAYLQWF
jgi:hypothetical protein